MSYVLEAIEHKYAYTAKRRPDLDDPARVERRESFLEVIDQFLAGSVPAHLAGPVRGGRQRHRQRGSW